VFGALRRKKSELKTQHSGNVEANDTSWCIDHFLLNAHTFAFNGEMCISISSALLMMWNSILLLNELVDCFNQLRQFLHLDFAGV